MGAKELAGAMAVLIKNQAPEKSPGALVRKAGFEPARPCGH